jgi:predicted O-linked N-acetylglucosamine transferase (SPINDLY family)
METAASGDVFEQGFTLHRQGQLAEAESRYRAVLAQQPGHFQALHFTGLIHYQRGNHAEAADWIGRAVAIDPAVAEAHSNLGLVLHELRRYDEALACHERALRLDPGAPESLNNRGNVLLALGRPLEALADYDEALRRQPDFALAHNNRGNALMALGRSEEAVPAYQRALRLMPDFGLALDNYGRALRDLKRFDEAAAAFARLLVLAPQHPYAPGMLFEARLNACDWTNYEAASAAIVAAVERGERADAPFSFVGHALSTAAQLHCARTFVAAEFPPSPALWKAGPARRDRIRIAYVSSDFREHAVAYLSARLFERHDRTQFEIFGISHGADDGGATRARLVQGFDRFVDVRGRSDRAIAQSLCDDGIDIAVDLNGFTVNSRTGMFAHRGAPLQVSFLGFPGTTGAPFFDYVIADRHVIPRHREAAYSEKIVRLPDSYQVNDDRRAIAAATPTRAELGLPERGFVFCSFNNSYKIRPAVFAVWMRLLQRVEGSVLWLIDDNAAATANLRRHAERHGVAANRLVFAPRLPLDQHLARHRQADLFLDTFPYTAHTTGSDALWAGLPLVTLAGETFASRVATSLLKAVGLPELVTDTLPAYEALALELASVPGKMAAAKAKLAERRRTAPLFDTDRFRRHLESAYLTMYDRLLRGQPPATFDVTPVD